jgi:hypothetical protein
VPFPSTSRRRFELGLPRSTGLGPVFSPLFGRVLAESTDALDQSMRPACPNRSSSARRRRCHTPASCQSRSRRQQVTPLQPNSSGSIRQEMSLLKT